MVLRWCSRDYADVGVVWPHPTASQKLDGHNVLLLCSLPSKNVVVLGTQYHIREVGITPLPPEMYVVTINDTLSPLPNILCPPPLDITILLDKQTVKSTLQLGTALIFL